MQVYLSRGRSDFEETPCGFAFRNCCKRNCISKDNGQFQKAKLRLRRLFLLRFKTHHRPTPAPLRVTSSQSSYDPREPAQRAGLLRGDYKTHPNRHPEHARIVSPVATYCSHLRARRSFAEGTEWMEQNRRRRDLIRV